MTGPMTEILIAIHTRCSGFFKHPTSYFALSAAVIVNTILSVVHRDAV